MDGSSLPKSAQILDSPYSPDDTDIQCKMMVLQTAVTGGVVTVWESTGWGHQIINGIKASTVATFKRLSEREAPAGQSKQSMSASRQSINHACPPISVSVLT